MYKLLAALAIGAAGFGVAPRLISAFTAPAETIAASQNLQAVAVAEMDLLGAGMPVTPVNVRADLALGAGDVVTAGPSTNSDTFSVAPSADPSEPGAGVAVMGGAGKCQAAFVNASDPDRLAVDDAPVETVPVPAGAPCVAPTLPPAGYQPAL